MTLTGIKLRVVGRDATLMRGRDGTDSSYETNTLAFGAGESFDAIFKAPPHSGGSGPDKYVLFNRTYTRADNLAGGGGQRTEVHVHPDRDAAGAALPERLGPVMADMSGVTPMSPTLHHPAGPWLALAGIRGARRCGHPRRREPARPGPPPRLQPRRHRLHDRRRARHPTSR